MPKCLHVVHVAVEINTNKISVLDSVIKSLNEAATVAVQKRANTCNVVDRSLEIEVIR